MFECVPEGADGTDGLPLTQLRAFFEVLRLFLGRNTRQQRLTARQGRQHQGAVVGDQLFGQTLDVHRLLPQRRQLSQSGRAILCFDGVRDAEQVAPVGDTGHPADNVGVDFCRDTGAGVQNRQRVTERTVGKTGNQLGTF